MDNSIDVELRASSKVVKYRRSPPLPGALSLADSSTYSRLDKIPCFVVVVVVVVVLTLYLHNLLPKGYQLMGTSTVIILYTEQIPMTSSSSSSSSSSCIYLYTIENYSRADVVVLWLKI